ncbi:MAG: aminomethyl-transferring glycine dehydrogenase subunit GcvPA [Candidatus Margulisiibacteriota bacterium]|jgi:glycine dehydrogenase subunit 1
MKEINVKKEMVALAGKNQHSDQLACFLGAGAYKHWIPSAVDHLVSRAEFYTAYTPYQPEISQGTLQTIFEYQSWICKLTGMDVTNASMYDGATAMAEAALMAMRITHRNEIVLVGEIHPDYREVVGTYLEPHGVRISEVKNKRSKEVVKMNAVAAVIVQRPAFDGEVMTDDELKELSGKAKAAGAIFVACVDPISLGLLSRPNTYGADIVIGEGQPLGMHLNYGGPYLGFLACREEYLRQMPGRIIGETVDQDGKRAFVLTMQTREQHIRREKATSNICSNEALCALTATVYLSLIGEKGLKEVALACKTKTDQLKKELAKCKGVNIENTGETFKEFVAVFSFKSGQSIKNINEELLKNGILGGCDLGQNRMLIAVTEMIGDEAMAKFVEVVKEYGRLSTEDNVQG